MLEMTKAKIIQQGEKCAEVNKFLNMFSAVEPVQFLRYTFQNATKV